MSRSPPDGQRLAMSLLEDGPASGDDVERVVVMNEDGTGAHTMWRHTNDPGDDGWSPPRLDFSPDGRSLLLNHSPDDDWTRLLELDLDTEELTTIAEVERPALISGGSWTADGTSIVYSYSPGGLAPDMEIVQVTTDGHVIDSWATGDEAWAPRPSPDGTKVAYFGWDPVDEQYGVYVMDLEIESVEEVAEDTTTDFSLRWSPDGQDLVYMARTYIDEEEYLAIKRVSSEGGTPTTVMEADSSFTLWSFALRSLTDLPAQDSDDALVEGMAAEYYVDEYGGTLSQVEDWMAVQDRGEGLSDVLDNELPNGTFGGLWFDNTTRRVKVAVTDEAPTTTVDAILARRDLDGATDVVEDVAANAAVPVDIVAVAAGELTVEPLACDFTDCDPPLRGGMFIQSTTEDEDGNHPACTAGFIARSRSDARLMDNCDPGSGDSGGPVFRNHRAFGLIQGIGGECEITFQSARRAQNSLNANIVTGK
jgi:Tol biopolymer transport system component